MSCYVTWYLVERSDKPDMRICKTETDRDEYIAELCDEFERLQIPNTDRPKITIRIDRHAKPNGLLM